MARDGSNQFLRLNKGESVAAGLAPNSFTGITPGYTYDLSFSFYGANSGNGNDAPNTQIGIWSLVTGANPFAGAATVVTTGDLTEKATFGTPTNVNTTFVLPGSSNYSANTVWLLFTATAQGSGSNTIELNIDNVSAVPEPQTYALMLAGLGALGFLSGRRRQG